MPLLRHEPDAAEAGRRQAGEPVRPGEPLPPSERIRQGHGDLRADPCGGSHGRRGLLVAGAVPVRHRVRGGSGEPQARADGESRAVRLDPGGRGLQVCAGERRRGPAERVRGRGQCHRGNPEGHPGHLQAGGALRRVHLLQGDGRERTPDAGQRAGDGAVSRADEGRLQGVLRAHHAGGQDRQRLRALHLRRAELGAGDGGAGHEAGAFQRGVGEERVEPLSGADQERRGQDAGARLPRHGPLRPAGGVRPPAGAGHGQAGIHAGPDSRNQEDSAQGRAEAADRRAADRCSGQQRRAAGEARVHVAGGWRLRQGGRFL